MTRTAQIAGFWGGVRTMTPLAPADFIDGLAFGALAVAAGLGHVAPVVMSATAFSGSAQYAAVAVLRDGGTLLAAVIAAAALNARYLVMGATVAATTGGSRWRRAARCLTLTDESFVLGARGGGGVDAGILVGAGVLSLVAWTAGTAAGVLVGAKLGDISTLGLDAAFPALFLWVLRGELATVRGRVAALFGAVVALALVPLAPPGTAVLVAGVAAGVWGALR